METISSEPKWTVVEGAGPIIATAIHDGHSVRAEVLDRLAIDEPGRLREEDPYTGEWTAVVPTRVVGLQSRFEVDLNRPRERAVYIRPEDAWGLHVWREPPPDDIVARSLAIYDGFYAEMERLLRSVEKRHGRFVVFDLHTYNHRREGTNGPPADPLGNPQVNLGTGTMDRARWSGIVDRFVKDLGAFDFPGGRLDVRENVKFQGGAFGKWIHETFPESGCAIAIEFKKFFMEEWTGVRDETLSDAIHEALRSTVPGVIEELGRSGPRNA
ncbi:MAG: N-formylglutamate amidohydrolase [Acidobacteria bacterium]|nr:N-formylglutamate amidohydrolase [Acidobacteriota bacterium]MDA1234051.1 N-formylglutamate amidohydrolase [Acidobacteriota bacterium]